MILVVGSTGQLGTEIVRRALREGADVAALVRPDSDHRHLAEWGVELREGDLRDGASLERACLGVDAVIATATVVFPRGRYSFAEDEGAGYQNLVDACGHAGVRQFIFTSILLFDDFQTQRVPTLRMKYEVERMAEASGVPFTFFRASLFMDDYFALMGSEIPLRGARAATLRRSFWFKNLYLGAIHDSIERRGLAVLPGPRSHRHSFVALDDVAELHLRSVGHPAAMNSSFDVGGPAMLSWADVVEIYSRLLGRRVRSIAWHPALARLGMELTRPFSEAAANQLGILWANATQELVCDAQKSADVLGVRLTSAEEFLEAKLRLPPGS